MLKKIVLFMITIILAILPCVASADHSPVRDSCDAQFPGDANGDGMFTVGDLIYLTRFLYNDGPAPTPMANGDVNCDCTISTEDLEIVYTCLNEGILVPCTCTCVEPEVIYPVTCQGLCGDANADAKVDISDAVYIFSFAFGGGSSPQPVTSTGDANSDAAVDISDAVYIINFAFGGGPPPTDCSPGSWENQGGDCCPYSM